MARDARRKPTWYAGESAVFFCPIGAMRRVSRDSRLQDDALLMEAQRQLALMLECSPESWPRAWELRIARWNDSAPNKEVVLKLLDRVIAQGVMT